PNGSGLAETTGLPSEFGPQTNVIWKVPLPPGASSPVLTKERIFVTAAASGALVTFCLNRTTGATIWRRELPAPRSEPRHKLNHAASSTPATDGENVYVFFGEFGLISYGPSGNERWRMPLGPFSNLHGMAASPILIGEKLVMVCDQDNDSFLLALNKENGSLLWKSARPEVVHGFATPTVFFSQEGPAQVIVPGSYQVVAYSAETGEKIWWVAGLTWQVKTTAIVAGDTVYATGWAPGADEGQRLALPPFEVVLKAADTNGDGKISSEELPEKWKHSGSWDFIDLERDGLLDPRDWSFYRARRSSQNVTMAIRPAGRKGDLTETGILWKQERSVPQVSSPLLYRGLLYTIKDGGILTSFDPATGAILKQGRLRDAIGNYYASPVAADDKIFLPSETGKVAVVSPGADWQLLRVNDLGESCYATPALAGGRIYLRTGESLYCFGKQPSHDYCGDADRLL
ncbi:MAG: PQQ-binding-like beta-propeller repeat protein, partial [Gammaproteobacteria bacterium]